MRDLIEREDAVNAVYHHFPSMSKADAEGVLYEVPSAGRPKGHWINKGIVYSKDLQPVIKWECSECGSLYIGKVATWMCTVCGADMRGGEHG